MSDLTPSPAPVLPYLSAPQQVDTRMVRKSREQIHAMGVLWILFGSLAR